MLCDRVVYHTFSRDLRVLAQVLLGIDNVPPLIPIDESDHVDGLLREVLLEVLVERVMPPFVCLVHLDDAIVSVYELVVGNFALSGRLAFLGVQSLLTLQVLIELRLGIDIHLLIEVFEQLLLLDLRGLPVFSIDKLVDFVFILLGLTIFCIYLIFIALKYGSVSLDFSLEVFLCLKTAVWFVPIVVL